MTYKTGFIMGLGIGALLWLPESGTVQSSPDVTMFARLLLATFTVLSLIIALASAFRRKSTVGPTGDGFIYGVTTSFGLLLVGSGKLV